MSTTTITDGRLQRLLARWRPSLLAHRDFRLMWLSSTVTSFGGQITMLALPLTAVVLLDATPRQMGRLAALEALPFSLVSLHAGVLIDRALRLPVIPLYEAAICLALVTVPLAALLGRLSMSLMYVVGVVLGTVFVFIGTAFQVYLTQIAGRDRLIAANSLFIGGESTARLTGPGLAGLLIQWHGALFAILFDCLTFVISPDAADPHPARGGTACTIERGECLERDPQRTRSGARPFCARCRWSRPAGSSCSRAGSRCRPCTPRENSDCRPANSASLT